MKSKLTHLDLPDKNMKLKWCKIQFNFVCVHPSGKSMSIQVQ